MDIKDKNELLQTPEGSHFLGVDVEGAYLRLRYIRSGEKGKTLFSLYLNDQGREVLRTSEFYEKPKPLPTRPKPNRRERFREAFFTVRLGLEAVLKCFLNYKGEK